ncbi:MAG: helix-turn-helix transcriptional regulator [Campylobacteraceae bacterium]|nr:helix-turn-helix transcriptional regulator [Campylobacteraceae bacterium]
MTKNFDAIVFSSIECSDAEMKSYYQKLITNSKKLRQEKGLSQLELSYLIGFKSTSLISGAEAGYGKVKFSIEHLYKIAKVLQVEVKEFFE